MENTSDEVVSLAGHYLTEGGGKKFEFGSAFALEAHGRVTVWCCINYLDSEADALAADAEARAGGVFTEATLLWRTDYGKGHPCVQQTRIECASSTPQNSPGPPNVQTQATADQ